MIGKAVSAVLDTQKNKIPLTKNEIIGSIEKQLEGENLGVSERQCPECGRNFSLLLVGETEIDCCQFCKSLWFDSGELKELTRQSRDVPSDDMVHRLSRYKCPVCGLAMRECMYKKPSNLLVDKCPDEHGVYLESGELKRAFEL